MSFSCQNVAGRRIFDVFGPWAYFFRQNVAGRRFFDVFGSWAYFFVKMLLGDEFLVGYDPIFCQDVVCFDRCADFPPVVIQSIC